MPFINFFYELSALIAPKYFANGESILQNACTEISNWPPLVAGECVQLPLLGTIFQTYIPSSTSTNVYQLQQQQRQSNNEIPIEHGSECTMPIPINRATTTTMEEFDHSGRSIDNRSNANADEYDDSDALANEDSILGVEETCDNIVNENGDFIDDGQSLAISCNHLSQMSLTKTTMVLSSVHEIDIFRSLSSVLPYIHLLWELVLTAEPIVVMASSPSDCSHMVQSLTR